MKEVISLYIGQAGVQIGNAIWELLSAEHGIDQSGSLEEPTFAIECIETFFGLTACGKYVPRALFVDLEPSVIDEVRSGAFKNLFHPDRLITGPEDAASNFARGFFTVGKLLLGTINNESRRLLEGSDSIQGIFLFRSLGGGTGAGLTSAIFDGLAEYPKITKIEVPIYPSPTLATAMVEPYNCLLGEHFCMEDIDVGLLLDNEALYDLCARYLTINYPTFTTINRLIAQLCSSITASVRFENVLNCDITVLQTNLVPYPRIHFPLANFAPVISQEKALHEELSVMELTRYVFERENQMMKVDHSFGRFMSCSLLYRGNISPFHVYQALSEVKKNKNIEFVDWCPTGFKVGINVSPPTTIPASLLAQSTKNVTMLTNTSAIGQAWQRLTHKFYLLYSKRSFVHWFIGEGMEECEFTESLYNISALVKDYEEAAMDTKYDEEENPETSPASGPATVGSINHDNAAAPEEDIINKEYTPSKESENNDNCEAISDDDKEEKGQVDGEIKKEEEKLQESAVEVSILEEVDNEGPNPEEFNAEETSVKDNIGETNVEEANDEVNAEEANEDINAEEANDEVNTEEENEEVNAEEANEEVNAEEANEEVNAEEQDEEVNAEEINEVNVEGNEEVNVEEVNEEVNAEEVNEEEANDEEINVQDETNVEDKEEGNEEAEEAISEESGITEEEDQNNDNQTTDTEGYYINEKGKIYQNYSNIQMKSRQDNGGAFENSSNSSDVYFNLTRSSWPQDYVKFDRELDTRKSLE